MTASGGRPRLGSLPNKIALLFFASIAVAFGAFYFYAVPELESELRERKLDEVAAAAATSRPLLASIAEDESLTAEDIDRRVRFVADAVDARLTLFGRQRSLSGPPGEPVFYVISDSREEHSYPANTALTRGALTAGRVLKGGRLFRGEELGQLAQPIPYRGTFERVALYSRDFNDVSRTVSFVESRLLIASGVALLIAMLGGYAVALSVARRVRRLEEAATEVAAGHHIDPLPVDSSDELGQLTQAFNDMQVQLRRVDIARREFVATASHELRTPIFSLGGFIEVLRSDDCDDAMRQTFLDETAEQVERLKKLAVDLLDLSQLDAGSVSLNVEDLDLAEVTRAVASEFAPRVKELDATLRLELPYDSVPATFDRERVAQILRILLDNALRHTGERPQICVSAAAAEGTAEVTVSDNGPGVPDGIPIFDRFITGDATQGAGLGLAIAQELAERHDGSLRGTNHDSGAKFSLTLPAPTSPESASS